MYSHSSPSFSSYEKCPSPSPSWWVPDELVPECLCISGPGEPRHRPSTARGSHQCWIDGKDHTPWPPSNTFPTATQDAVDPLCLVGSLLVHGQLGGHQDPLDPFLQSWCPAGQAPACPGECSYSSHRQHFAIPFGEHPEAHVGQFMQPVEVSLKGTTPTWCVSHHFISSTESLHSRRPPGQPGTMFPGINPQWIPSILFFVCLEMISRIFCFIMFMGFKVRL